jgi:malate synthase
VTPELIGAVIDDEMKRIEEEIGASRFEKGRFAEARALFERISTASSLETFLTLPAYEALDRGPKDTARDKTQ